MTESFGDIASEPDLASKIAAAIMGLRWSRISDEDECDKRHGQLQEIVAKYIAAPTAKGGAEDLREAASMAAMYLRTGFINCERCGHEQPTKDTDALYTLNEALASPPPPAGAAGGGSGDMVLFAARLRNGIAMAENAGVSRIEAAGDLDTWRAVLVRIEAPTPDLRAQGEQRSEGKIMTDDFPHTAETSRGWMDTAAQHLRNEEYYRGLVCEIGRLFGDAAFTDDIGELHDSVLCAKVPELVREALAKRTRPIGGSVIEELGTPAAPGPDR